MKSLIVFGLVLAVFSFKLGSSDDLKWEPVLRGDV